LADRIVGTALEQYVSVAPARPQVERIVAERDRTSSESRAAELSAEKLSSRAASLFIGTKTYCLTNQLAFTWTKTSEDRNDPNLIGKYPDLINEEWYGTTIESPVYAAVRVKWSPSRPKIGQLKCTVNTGHLENSLEGKENMQCVFTPNNSGKRTENYFAAINKFSGDIGPDRAANLAWQVFAPPEKFKPGALAFKYEMLAVPYGKEAPANVGNVLVENSANNSRPISLQPDQSESDHELTGHVAALTPSSGK
jgi:Protein of unknown function (DUF992)